MIRNLLLASAAVAMVTVAQPALAAPAKSKAAASATLPASNPFAKPSTLPFQTPDFSTIKDSDYLPALLAGMAAAEARGPRDRQQPRAADLRQHARRDGALGPAARARQPRVQRGQRREHQRHAAGDRHQDRAAVRRAQRFHLSQREAVRSAFKTLHDHAGRAEPQPRAGEAARRLLQAVRACRRRAAAGQAGRSSRRSTSSSARCRPQFSQKLLAAAKAGALHVDRCVRARRPVAASRSPPRRRRRRTARSPAMSCRCRTRRSSRRSIR